MDQGYLQFASDVFRLKTEKYHKIVGQESQGSKNHFSVGSLTRRIEAGQTLSHYEMAGENEVELIPTLSLKLVTGRIKSSHWDGDRSS